MELLDRLDVRLDVALRARLDERAAVSKVSRATVVRRALEAYLADGPAAPAKPPALPVDAVAHPAEPARSVLTDQVRRMAERQGVVPASRLVTPLPKTGAR